MEDVDDGIHVPFVQGKPEETGTNQLASNEGNKRRSRAASNYFQLDDQKLVNTGTDVRRSMQAFALLSQKVVEETPGTIRSPDAALLAANNSSNATLMNEDIFEFLGKLYGFQPSSIQNQKEHLGFLLSNTESHQDQNVPVETSIAIAINDIFARVFENYIKWCQYIRTEPIFPYADDRPLPTPNRGNLISIALYLLIWGESANLRFMPECICFIYHKLALRLVDYIYASRNSGNTVSDKNTVNQLQNLFPFAKASNGFISSGSNNHFLDLTVKPIYDVLSDAGKGKRTGLNEDDASSKRNYDDVNEFFWDPKCLQFDEYTIAEALKRQTIGKTFIEKRSFWVILLSFFRVYNFLLVMFHVLMAIAYVGYMGSPTSSTGFAFYSNFWISSNKKLRLHAFYTVFLTISALSSFRCFLEIWIGGVVIFIKHNLYATILFCRIVWHTAFVSCFACIAFSPLEFAYGNSSYLDIAPAVIVVYLTPILVLFVINSVVQSRNAENFSHLSKDNLPLGGNETSNNFSGLSKLSSSCVVCNLNDYVGKQVVVRWGIYVQYAAFWILLFALKFLFSLQVMIVPLIGPTVELYRLNKGSAIKSLQQLTHSSSLENKGIAESQHNVAFILALWIPVFLVYLYDTQIWFTLFISACGIFQGIRDKIGFIQRVEDFMSSLRKAPSLFDSKIVSIHAQTMKSSKTGVPDKENSSSDEFTQRLRFAVVWNEIISSFRLGDLISDREGTILMYRIRDNGVVEDPVFLHAGDVSEIIQVIMKLYSRRKDSLSLGDVRNALMKKCLLTPFSIVVELSIDVLGEVLGEEDKEVTEVFVSLKREIEGTSNSTRLSDYLRIRELPDILEKFVAVLEALLNVPSPSATSVEELGRASHSQLFHVTKCFEVFLSKLKESLQQKSMFNNLDKCVFAHVTSSLAHQKERLKILFKEDKQHSTSAANHQATSLLLTSILNRCTRLFLLLTLDKADALPRCNEARRRLSFFLNSLGMKIPPISRIARMGSFSVITPYYGETVLYSIEELNSAVAENSVFWKTDNRKLTILKYLTICHAEEWENFLERAAVANLEDALKLVPTQVRLWASNRGQTLARTVQGIMLYEDAIKMLHWLEIGSYASLSYEDKTKEMEYLVKLKFSYITSCQLYSKHQQADDPRAKDIDFLMKKYPNWRVSYVDERVIEGGKKAYDAVLVKSNNNVIEEVYRYELPGPPTIGEGKPENQNIAIQFSRGEYLQTIDMNQEHYFEETLKIPNFLSHFQDGPSVRCVGMKEHIFTGKMSSLARFMTLQELVFVGVTQRVMSSPLCSRMHYGHPDIFDKIYVMSTGGVSKASKGINLSEDVFAGYNITLRGGQILYKEYILCGKGRDITLPQISAFEAKLSTGSAESSLSREAFRLGAYLDFFRLHSLFYGHMGFYFCNFLVVACVFAYAYSKLYVVVDLPVTYALISRTQTLDDLAAVLNTQFIYQFGLLMTVPLVVTLVTEAGILETALRLLELITTLGPFFYMFETGTKAYYYDLTIMRGGSKYRATGRGFSITRELFIGFYKQYAYSHFYRAIELCSVMILFGVFGRFNIGKDIKAEYCKVNDCEKLPLPDSIKLFDSYSHKGQDYGIASFAVWILVAAWILVPFFFNTDGFDFVKTKVDIKEWVYWMFGSIVTERKGSLGAPLMSDNAVPSPPILTTAGDCPLLQSSNPPRDVWINWWRKETHSYNNISPMGRIGYLLRSSRHFFVMYYIYTLSFEPTIGDFTYLFLLFGIVVLLLNIHGEVIRRVLGPSKTDRRDLLHAAGYIFVIHCCPIILTAVMGISQGWKSTQCVSLYASVHALLFGLMKVALCLHGVCGYSAIKWRFIQELSFMYDSLYGIFMLAILFILSALPFMNTLQTRLMYNEGFSRALSQSGSEYAAFLSSVIGILGGMTFGWMKCFAGSLGNLNNVYDDNRSFRYFLEQDLHISKTEFKKQLIPVYYSFASVVGVCISCFISRCFGRLPSLIIGSFFTYCCIVCLFVGDVHVITLGVSIIGLGVAMISTSIVQYNYEICRVEWRGRSILFFFIGSTLGYIVESVLLHSLNAETERLTYLNRPSHQWRWQAVYGIIPLSALVLGLVICRFTIFFVPETPIFAFSKKDTKKAEEAFAHLRQRNDVREEIEELKQAWKPADGPLLNSYLWRLMLITMLQFSLALVTSAALMPRLTYQVSNWTYHLSLCILGALLIAVLMVDSIRRKTILKDVLPFVGVTAIIVGVFGLADDGSNSNSFVGVILYLEHFAVGISVVALTWFIAIDLFPLYQSDIFLGLSMLIYYLGEGLVYYMTPSFSASHFILAGLSGVMSILLFSVFASTKDGGIRLKSEKKKEKELHSRESRPPSEEDDETFTELAHITSSTLIRHRHSRSSRSHSQLRAVSGRKSFLTATDIELNTIRRNTMDEQTLDGYYHDYSTPLSTEHDV